MKYFCRTSERISLCVRKALKEVSGLVSFPSIHRPLCAASSKSDSRHRTRIVFVVNVYRDWRVV